MVFRWLTPFAAALLIVVVAGCAGPASPGSTVAPEPSVTPEETFSSPAPEPTQSLPTPTGKGTVTPSLALPRLPIGGAAEADADERRQCVGISWIANVNGSDTFPAGYAVEITRAWFSDKGFEVIKSGCGSPNCLGHIMRSGSSSCSLAVRALPGADPATSVSVGLKGIMYCPKSVGRTQCRRLIESLDKQQPQHAIPLLPAPEPTAPTDSGTTSETGADDEQGPDPGTSATPSGG